MKTLQQKNKAQNLSGEVDLARILLAKAESQLTTAREQARIARRRRKEAKQAARHAKKQARQAREQVAEAKLALAEAEEKMAKTKPRPVKRKTRRKPAKKVVAAAGQKKSSRPVAIQARKPAEKTQPTAKRGKSKPKTAPRVKAAKKPVAVPRDLEIPVVTAAAKVGKATKEIVKGVEEIFGETIPAETRAEPGATESVTPPVSAPATPKPIVTD
jgi:hypothetical protein